MMMTMVMMIIINSDDDDNEESNGSHFSWQEYKYFFYQAFGYKKRYYITVCLCVYLQSNASTTVKAAGAYTNNTRLTTLHNKSELQKGQAIWRRNKVNSRSWPD